MHPIAFGRLRISAVVERPGPTRHGPVTVLGTHFHHPTAGRIVRHGDTWRFQDDVGDW